jgi:uncharacterized membrane-anchored protein
MDELNAYFVVDESGEDVNAAKHEHKVHVTV